MKAKRILYSGGILSICLASVGFQATVQSADDTNELEEILGVLVTKHTADGTALTVPSPQYVTEQRENLKGLKGVRVVVEGITPETEKLGLHRASIKKDVELLLHQHDIKVLSEEDWRGTNGTPYLHVWVTDADELDGRLSGGIFVTVMEQVVLLRDPSRCTFGVVYSQGRVFPYSEPDTVRQAIKSCVAMFIGDYLAANPNTLVGRVYANDEAKIELATEDKLIFTWYGVEKAWPRYRPYEFSYDVSEDDGDIWVGGMTSSQALRFPYQRLSFNFSDLGDTITATWTLNDRRVVFRRVTDDTDAKETLR